MGGEIQVASRREARPGASRRSGVAMAGVDHRRLARIDALANGNAGSARLAAMQGSAAGGSPVPGAGVVQRVEIEELSDEEAARTSAGRVPDRVEEPAAAASGAREGGEVEPGADPESLWQRYKTFDEENRATLEKVGVGLLIVAGAWQTLRARTGQEPPSRGKTIADQLGEQMSAAVDTLDKLRDPVAAVKRASGRSGWEGFKQGINPMPMPYAREYASPSAILQMVYRATFVLLSGRKGLEEHVRQVEGFARRRAGVGTKGQVVDWPPLVAAGTNARNRAGAGFMGGIASGTWATRFTSMFASPFLYVQMPWDTVHMLNQLTLDDAKRRRASSGLARQIHTYNARLMATKGRAMWVAPGLLQAGARVVKALVK